MDFEGMLEEQSGGMDTMCCFIQGSRGGALGSTSCGMQSVLILGFSGADVPNSESLALLYGQVAKAASPSISHSCFFFHVSHQSCQEVSASPQHDNRRLLSLFISPTPLFGLSGVCRRLLQFCLEVLTVQQMHF